MNIKGRPFLRNKLSSVPPLKRWRVGSSLWDPAYAGPLAAEPGDNGRAPSPYLAFLRVEIAAFHPAPKAVTLSRRLVSVALIRPPCFLAEVGITHYAALGSSDFPLRHALRRSDPLPKKGLGLLYSSGKD